MYLEMMNGGKMPNELNEKGRVLARVCELLAAVGRR